MHTLFTGCSYTAGVGFEQEKEDPRLWVNQLHKLLFSDTVKNNAALGGRSNAGIFQDTIKNLSEHPTKYAFVEWTSYPRYELSLGFETYDTSQLFSFDNKCRDHNLNNINYSASYLNSIRDRFTSLSHPCQEIKKIIEYSSIISNIANLTGTKVFFINGLAAWDQDFFIKKTTAVPSEFTKYTQQILNVSNRDDIESLMLYDLMHQTFSQASNSVTLTWLNLYQSMQSTKIDVNSDGLHPGPESNKQYSELFAQKLNSIL